jgi:hypothetical protein
MVMGPKCRLQNATQQIEYYCIELRVDSVSELACQHHHTHHAKKKKMHFCAEKKIDRHPADPNGRLMAY